jgi:hypothetical protein
MAGYFAQLSWFSMLYGYASFYFSGYAGWLCWFRCLALQGMLAV